MTPTAAPATDGTTTLLLLGNPNAGKTSLFNRLCGARARTANYPGITVDARVGRGFTDAGAPIRVVDLPGVYSLDVETPEAEIVRQAMEGDLEGNAAAAIVVADATNLPRHLRLALEARARGRRVLLALNMIDRSEATGVRIDVDRLARRLGAPVIPMDSRHGRGVDALRHEIGRLGDASANGAPIATGDLPALAEEIAAEVVDESDKRPAGFTATLDRALLHPVVGTLTFLVVMGLLFGSLFELAAYPMDWIEMGFAWLGEAVRGLLAQGAFADLVVDGLIGGIAGTAVFVPQIALLFLFLTMLEDTGYLARAALVIDRLMRRFGLPGQAFVPLLSSHACALPGIACARLIPNPRDRLATILVAPFMSCSARLPVYAMLTGLLFPDDPLYAGLAFAGCYALGAGAALVTAWIARGTILRGAALPMALELPRYGAPSMRNALLTAYDRSRTFLVKAGTVIVCICVVLWWLSSYPSSDPSPEAAALRDQAVASTDADRSEELLTEADRLDAQHALRNSFAGRIGTAGEAVLGPIGADWRISIAVVTSFAAREVFVSTMMVVLGQGEEADPGETRVLDRVRSATRDDGSRLFSRRAALSLLVFYVLALQCLPTLAVTRRESGSIKWALLQFAWMSSVAWVSAFVVYQGLGALGWA